MPNPNLTIRGLLHRCQVAFYKATKGADGKGKRLFRMAPFHHHLELGGWPEVGVVQAFYLAALAFATGGGLVAVF